MNGFDCGDIDASIGGIISQLRAQFLSIREKHNQECAKYVAKIVELEDRLSSKAKRIADLEEYAIAQPMETAPESDDILIRVDDNDNKGEYWVTGWKSARAWRSNHHVNAKPLAWVRAPKVNVESGKSE